MVTPDLRNRLHHQHPCRARKREPHGSCSRCDGRSVLDADHRPRGVNVPRPSTPTFIISSFSTTNLLTDSVKNLANATAWPRGVRNFAGLIPFPPLREPMSDRSLNRYLDDMTAMTSISHYEWSQMPEPITRRWIDTPEAGQFELSLHPRWLEAIAAPKGVLTQLHVCITDDRHELGALPYIICLGRIYGLPVRFPEPRKHSRRLSPASDTTRKCAAHERKVSMPLVAVTHRHPRRIPSWWISHTPYTRLSVAAFGEASQFFRKPKIFNIKHQFSSTSDSCTDRPKNHATSIRMNRNDRCEGRVHLRLRWHSAKKYHDIYRRADQRPMAPCWLRATST